MSDEQPNGLPPSFLLHSFMVVAGAYVINIVLLLTIAFIVFPDAVALLGAEAEEYKKVLDNQPERIFPQGMFWLLLISSSVTCSVLGYFVAKLAPLAKWPHAIFFAAILFVQYLQLSIGSPAEARPKLILLMAISSIAALIGADRYLKKHAAPDTDDTATDESVETQNDSF